MAAVKSFFTTFLSLFILLLHLGCFVFASKTHRHHQPTKKRKLSFSLAYLKKLFTSKIGNSGGQSPALSTGRSSRHTLATTVVQQSESQSIITDPPSKKSSICEDFSGMFSDQQLFPLRNDIYPCTICGEIFSTTQSLEQHESIKHAVSELIDGDSGKNIVKIIFQTGWRDVEKSPKVHRILKIHNCQKIVSRFEEYRETVKGKAARNINGVRKRDERCVADGNELLRFHCSTFVCNLGLHGNSSICNQQHCSICGIIRSGFSPKLDGIPTHSSSWRGHLTMPEDVEEEFGFMNIKRAMLVCRVVAGRIGCESDEAEKGDGCGFDSVGGVNDDELLVYNPRAVLPCFVIVYSV